MMNTEILYTAMEELETCLNHLADLVIEAAHNRGERSPSITSYDLMTDLPVTFIDVSPGVYLLGPGIPRDASAVALVVPADQDDISESLFQHLFDWDKPVEGEVPTINHMPHGSCILMVTGLEEDNGLGWKYFESFIKEHNLYYNWLLYGPGGDDL